MRNLKKSLALVLVLAMVLTTVSGAVFSDVPLTHDYSDAINMLNDLGVLTGYADGTYLPEGTITRAEMCAVIYRMLSGKTNASNFVGPSAYSDVAASFWGVGFINYCTELGIVNGYPDGTFKPDVQISYAEAITMIIRALGLDKNLSGTSKNLSYPAGYIAQADLNAVNDDVDLSANDNANRGAVAQLIYNAIFNASYTRVMDSEDESKTTVAEYVFGISKSNNIITAVGEYGLGGCDDDSFSAVIADPDNAKKNDQAFSNAEFARLTKKDVGKRVEIYYDDDDEVLAVVDTNKNNSVTVAATSFYKDGAKTYYKANGVEKTIDNFVYTDDGDSNFIVILNGVQLSTSEAVNALTAYLVKDTGAKNDNRYTAEITLLSNDGTDKSIEYVFIDEYAFAKVSAVESDVINLKDQKYYLPNGANVDYADVELFDDNDEAYDVVKPDSLKKDNYVMVYKDNSDDADINGAEIILCDDLTGKYTKRSGSDYTFGGETYKFAFGTDAFNGKLGETYDYVVDGKFGYIVKSDKGNADVSDYYLVEKTTADKDKYDDITYYATVFDYTGKEIECTIDDDETFFDDVMDGAGSIMVLTVNSKNKITDARYFNAADDDLDDANQNTAHHYDASKDDEYKTTNSLWKLDSGDTLDVVDDTLIFYYDKDADVTTSTASVKSYKPYTTGKDLGVGNEGKIYSYENTDGEVIAAIVYADPKGAASTKENIYGYVTKVTTIDVDADKAYAEVTVAANGEVKVIETETADRDDIAKLNDGGAYALKNQFIMFDLTSDGKIVFDEKVSTVENGDLAQYADEDLVIIADAEGRDIDECYMMVMGYGVDDINTSKYYVTIDGTKYTIADDAVVYTIDRDNKKASVSSVGAIQESNTSYNRYITVIYDDDNEEIVTIFYENYKLADDPGLYD